MGRPSVCSSNDPPHRPPMTAVGAVGGHSWRETRTTSSCSLSSALKEAEERERFVFPILEGSSSLPRAGLPATLGPSPTSVLPPCQSAISSSQPVCRPAGPGCGNQELGALVLWPHLAPAVDANLRPSPPHIPRSLAEHTSTLSSSMPWNLLWRHEAGCQWAAWPQRPGPAHVA